MKHSLESIRSSGLCSGCGLCAGMSSSGAVSMEESADGWLRPRVDGEADAKAIEAVEAACPGIAISDPAAEAGGARDSVWGPIADIRFAWSTDPALRYKASSGGGLSGLLAYLVETNEVEFVVTNAMDDLVPIRNKRVQVTDRDAIMTSAGSRYAPSAPLANIDALLDSGRRFAFVGKPCDVAALRQLGRVDHRVAQNVAWMFAFFCAGVPSYKGTDILLKEMGVPTTAEITSFRYRGEGWPGFAKAVTSDGAEYTMDYDTSWGRILNRHLQFRCKICPDGIGEFADISFADGWHFDDQGVATFDEAEGRSLTIVRKPEAVALFEKAIEAGYLRSEPADIEQIAAMQPFQALRKGILPARLAAYTLVGHRRPRFRGLDIMANARRVPFLLQLRNFYGTLRRLITKRTEG